MGTNFVRNIQIGFSSTDLHDHRQVAVLAGDVQGCVAMAILVVYITMMAEQTLDNFNLTPPHCQMQGNVTVLKHAQTHKTQNTVPVMIKVKALDYTFNNSCLILTVYLINRVHVGPMLQQTLHNVLEATGGRSE